MVRAISNECRKKITREYLIFLIIFISLTSSLGSLFTIHITHETKLGLSLEGVLPISFWVALLVSVAMMFYAMRFIGNGEKKMNMLFLVSCMLLIICMRGDLSIMVNLPYPLDAWARMSPIKHWLEQSYVDLSGYGYIGADYARNWPFAFLVSYSFVRLGADLYTFFLFAPIFIQVLTVFLVYLLMREIVGERKGLISAFLFALINTNSFFPLHWCPQLLGSSFFLLSTYLSIRFCREKSMRLLAVLMVSIFLLIITHHVSTLYFIFTTLGIWAASKFSKKVPLKIKENSIIPMPILVPIFTFILWFVYSWFVYPVALFDTMRRIVDVIFYGITMYRAGTLYYFEIKGSFQQASLLAYPVFILGTGLIVIFRTLARHEKIAGYWVSLLGWTALMSFVFIFGNFVMSGNYFEPARARELICMSFCPLSAEFLSELNSQKNKVSKSWLLKVVVLCILLTVATLSVYNIYLGASRWGVFSEPPEWW